MKRLLAALLALCLCPLLSGCSYSYLERQVFPICMSLDMDDEGRFEVGIQAPQSSTDAAPSYDIMSAQGDSFLDAMRMLAASTPYPMNFCQLRLLLVGYDLASRTELRPLLREIFELPTMRPNTYVMIALGSGLDVMKAQKPDLGARMSTQLNLLFERLREEKMLPDSTLSACVRDLGDLRRDPLICICAVNTRLKQQDAQKQSGEGAEQSGGGSQGGGAEVFAIGEPWTDMLLPEDVLAGTLPRSGSNPVEYLGSAAVSDGRVSGVLTAQETQVALRAFEEAKRRVAIDGERMQLQLLLTPGTELWREREALEKVMQKLVLLDCDALAFGEVAMTCFYTDAAWEAFNFRGKYKTAEYVIQ